MRFDTIFMRSRFLGGSLWSFVEGTAGPAHPAPDGNTRRARFHGHGHGSDHRPLRDDGGGGVCAGCAGHRERVRSQGTPKASILSVYKKPRPKHLATSIEGFT